MRCTLISKSKQLLTKQAIFKLPDETEKKTYACKKTDASPLDLSAAAAWAGGAGLAAGRNQPGAAAEVPGV